MQPSKAIQKNDIYIYVMLSWIQYQPYWIINSTNYYCLEILTLFKPETPKQVLRQMMKTQMKFHHGLHYLLRQNQSSEKEI